MIKEVIYKNRDNTIDLQLSSDSGVADFSGVTKVELIDESLGIISSDTKSSYFDWAAGGGVLKLSLGMMDGLVVGSSCRFSIILYDDDNTHGVNWGKFIAVVC